MTTSASMAVEALVARYDQAFLCQGHAANIFHSKPSELSSSRKDLVRRAFWHCSMMET